MIKWYDFDKPGFKALEDRLMEDFPTSSAVIHLEGIPEEGKDTDEDDDEDNFIVEEREPERMKTMYSTKIGPIVIHCDDKDYFRKWIRGNLLMMKRLNRDSEKVALTLLSMDGEIDVEMDLPEDSLEVISDKILDMQDLFRSKDNNESWMQLIKTRFQELLSGPMTLMAVTNEIDIIPLLIIQMIKTLNPTDAEMSVIMKNIVWYSMVHKKYKISLSPHGFGLEVRESVMPSNSMLGAIAVAMPF